ncbi:Mitochondrial adenine nucleotide transporter ADNT1 [Trichoplax sp. H2]|nr:Mitochondrial adenine nucleotide transporter ADNT1 [Trichoplax sp. H2]|eukprot:RDD47910.1 Mitochondrial adenine nucleotide transporter ADNT1 [Trichoplax sp. H2]
MMTNEKDPSLLSSRRNRHSTLLIFSSNTSKHLIAGGIAGAVSRTVVSPLERLKILFQLQHSQHEIKFKGIIPSLIQIGREEGFRGYFKGNGTNVVRMIPYMAVQFTAYEEYKKRFHISQDFRKHDSFRRLLAGALAGLTSVIVTYPLDLIRTRLAAQGDGPSRKYRSILHAAVLICRQEGGFFGGALYRGIGPSLMGVAPYVGLNFMIYENLKGIVTRRYYSTSTNGTSELPVPVRLMCGGIAGAASQSVTYPLDVIRRRMQMKGTNSNFAYTSTANAFATIIRVEGYLGLYKGMLPNVIKVAPAIAVNFVAYEFAKKMIYRYS